MRAMDAESIKAEIFFAEKEGKKYLKIVGKELGLRYSNARFGILSKAQPVVLSLLAAYILPTPHPFPPVA